MKVVIQIAVTFLVCYLLQSFLPWWTMALGAMAVGYLIGNKPFASFLSGLIGVAILWLTVAYFKDSANHSILSDKVNHLLPLNSFLLTALIGGVVGGLAALTGSLLRPKKRR